MKDEASGVPIVEFVGLKPKMYSYVTEDTKESRRAKGVQKAVVKREMKHASFLKELREPAENIFVNRRIQSFNHQLQTVAQEKRGLSAYDDKRFICPDGIHTIAYGHRDITDRVIDEDDGDPDLFEDTDDESDEAPIDPMINETPEEKKKRLFDEIGSAGGHRAMAKAVVPLDRFKQQFGEVSEKVIREAIVPLITQKEEEMERGYEY